MGQFYSIGELARLSGCKVATIRYYETQELMTAPLRTEGNQRRYNSQQRQRLQFIVHSRALGFSLASIRELLQLTEASQDEPHCAEKLVQRQLQDVNEKLRRLTHLQEQLLKMSQQCAAEGEGECAALQLLYDHELCDGEHD
ncbi:DNA-binding transcriptional MerR regulator [Sinobacterium caligoides]|uniref:DNA-binding transcriptional MerR regulator n=1 Tax=Sinobacterium caligoides TaxID=933926 RepID=A0A3N2DMG7_9GAMM|nr:MerR family transcriptional regulator [Sinobacterium caligoides]ROS01006.1 DNA-binding transcriptional MerR regulator [Sinobacterium caligoides]